MGNCVTVPSGEGFNSFKYRAVGRPDANGDALFAIWLDRGFTWVGRDRFFPGIGLTAFTPAFDTDFDATFDFAGPVGAEQLEVVLTDADADNINDLEQPGEESIANDISYELFGFKRDTL